MLAWLPRLPGPSASDGRLVAPLQRDSFSAVAFAQAAVRQDRTENIMPAKKQSTRMIDGYIGPIRAVMFFATPVS
jgi:hypothetical protein